MPGLVELTLSTPVGPVRPLASSGAWVGAYLPTQAAIVPSARATTLDAADAPPALRRAARELTEYFRGDRRSFATRIEPRGTAFQRAVWEVLRAIPFGERRTYAQVARALGRPSAVRAVGAAIGRNPLSIVVPCHRVVGSDGSLTGYAGGLEAKRWLLAHEGALSPRTSPRRGGRVSPS